MARRRKENKRAERSSAAGSSENEPDDLVEFAGGHMARWGRFITFEVNRTEEEHAALLTSVVGLKDEIVAQQERRRERLIGVLKEADAVDLIARLSLTYLHIDADTFKESETDRSPAHVEYLGLQILGEGLMAPANVDPPRQSELTGEAIEIVREMFESSAMLIMIAAAEELQASPGDPGTEYALKTRLASLGVRGTGYAEHLDRMLTGCLSPFDDECRRHLGFTASEALTMREGIAALLSDRVNEALNGLAEQRREALRELKRARRKKRPDGPFPAWLLELPPSEARRHVDAGLVMGAFEDSRRLALINADDLAFKSGLQRATCAAFLQAFTCPQTAFEAAHHRFPTGAHPLTIRPFLLVADDAYLLPSPSTITDAIRPRMEDLLSETPVWERYLSERGKYLEHAATELLASALPGSQSWTDIEWRGPDDSSDLDGLVLADDLALRIQCKAGRLSASSRRGAPDRMKRDIRELIEGAAEQHIRLDRAVATDGPVALGLSEAQARGFSAPFQFEVIVCLDEITVWATEAHELREWGTLPGGEEVPWIISLTDLMAVVDLLRGSELAHYLVRRQRIERDGRMAAHDELDWVGHYLAEGLFFDNFFDGDDPPDEFRLTTYTEPIDAWYFTRAGDRRQPAPKPSQDIPPGLRALLQRLEHERPRRWITAAVALLDGDSDSRQAWHDAVDRARVRVPAVGWSNATQVFNGRLGVTVMTDLRIDWPLIRRQARDYCHEKARAAGLTNWLGIGEGRNDGLFVVAVEDDGSRLADLFLSPPGQGGSTPD